MRAFYALHTPSSSFMRAALISADMQNIRAYIANYAAGMVRKNVKLRYWLHSLHHFRHRHYHYSPILHSQLATLAHTRI